MRPLVRILLLGVSAATLAACSGSTGGGNSAGDGKAASTASANAPPAPPLPAAPTGNAADTASLEPAPPDDPQAQAINSAALPAKASAKADPGLVRAQVLLARAHFSPGVIDGLDGENFRNALTAFQRAHDLPADGRLDAQAWAALTQADTGAVVTRYVITPADVRGPFTPVVPRDDLKALAKLERLDYATPLEMLAERFHMDEALLQGLNPGADFGRAGTPILVTIAPEQKFDRPVAAVEVDKSARQVRALAADGQLLAVYPATVGSTERPAPSGETKIKGVAQDPPYTYDPKRLTFGDKSLGKVTIEPGPNNPVGVTWIDLGIPTYGIHGAPDPKLVGKVASHGCVRLTNWDIRELAAAVKPGVKVTFVGREGAPKTPPASDKRKARA